MNWKTINNLTGYGNITLIMNQKQVQKYRDSLLKKMQKYQAAFQKNPPQNIYAKCSQNDPLHWEGTIIGPEGSPYEGGVFFLDIRVPKDYPLKPLQVRFITKIYHPNVSEDGEIGIDILNDQWSPSLTIEKVLLSICSLLTDPNTFISHRPEIAHLHDSDRAQYERNGRVSMLGDLYPSIELIILIKILHSFQVYSFVNQIRIYTYLYHCSKLIRQMDIHTQRRIRWQIDNLERDIQKDSMLNFTVGVHEQDLSECQATLIGPNNTPYEGGVFCLSLNLIGYPFRPPKIIFLTKIYHPNINSEGEISLDILRDQWSPALTIRTTLLSITSLLCDPFPDEPLVPEIAQIYKNDIEQFNYIARTWTRNYAK